MNEKTWFLFPRTSLGCGLTAVTVVLPLVLLRSELGNTLCTYPAGAVNIKWAELPLCDFACRRARSTHSMMNIHGLTPWIVTATRIEWLIPTLTHAQEGKENDTLSSWDTRAHERKKILKAANTRTPGCIIFQRSHPWGKKRPFIGNQITFQGGAFPHSLSHTNWWSWPQIRRHKTLHPLDPGSTSRFEY